MSVKLHDMILAVFDRACPQERKSSSWQDDDFVVRQALAYLHFHLQTTPDGSQEAFPFTEDLLGYFCTELTESLEVRQFLRSLRFHWEQPYTESQYRDGILPSALSCGSLRIHLERGGEDSGHLLLRPVLPDYRSAGSAIKPDATQTLLLEDIRLYSRDAADFCQNLERAVKRQLLRMFCIQQNMDAQFLLPNGLGVLDAFLLHPDDPEALSRLNLIRSAGFLFGGSRIVFLASDREGHPVMPSPTHAPDLRETGFISCQAVLPTVPSEDGFRTTETIPFPVRPVPLHVIQNISPGGERASFLEQVVTEGCRYAGSLAQAAVCNGN